MQEGEMDGTASPPGLGTQLVVLPRPTLYARLEAGAAAGITIVSGPAGSGKTVLVQSWLAATAPRQVAWVTIPRGGSDAHALWVAMLGAVSGLTGTSPLTRLEPTPVVDAAAAHARLRSALDNVAEPRTLLVIDDLGELALDEAVLALDTLLADRPSRLSVVLISRGEPGLGLHRQRLDGAVVEIRPEDLRFSQVHTAQLLAGWGVSLAGTEVALLHERTEGWAAAIRLAALSLMGHPDPARFLAEFSGTERTIASYLMAEVLDRLPPEVRRLLLRASILDRVSGPLADAVAGTTGAEAMLRGLEEAGALVVSLDASRSWFRFHHLLVDLLGLELRRQEPEEVNRLHLAAAAWLAAHDDPLAAVAHAAAAEAWPMAVTLLADSYFSLVLDGQQRTVHELLRGFPRDLGGDPELAVMLAADELARGSLGAAERHLDLAARAGARVLDERRGRFELAVAFVRLSLARRRGDFGDVLDLMHSAEAIEPASSAEVGLQADLRAWALLHLGIVETWSGRSGDGARHLHQARELARRIGRVYLELACTVHLASARTASSFLDAEDALREVIADATARGWENDPALAPAWVSLGVALMQTGRLSEAEAALDRAELGLVDDLEPAVASVLHGARGAVDLARGQLIEAVERYCRALELSERLLVPPRLLDQFVSARMLARLGLGETGPVQDELGELPASRRHQGEFLIVEAELALLAGDSARARSTLEQVTSGQVPVHHRTVKIRARLREAELLAQASDHLGLEHALEDALELAESDRLVLGFVRPGVRELLARLPRHRTHHGAFLAEIMDLLGGGPPAAGAGQRSLRPDERLGLTVEPLTDVEVRVLRLLPTNLTLAQIGGELYVSANTVKTHVRHIYQKLGVHTRTLAVQRARQLGMLSPSLRG